MRPFKRLAVALGLLLVVAAILLWFDDPLSPDTQSLPAVPATAGADRDTYLFLMGINAPAGVDPRVHGEAVHQHNEAQARVPPTAAELLEIEHLPEPDWRELRDRANGDNLRALFEAQQRGDALLEEHAVLLQRYRDFSGMRGYATFYPPSAVPSLAPYSALFNGHRLQLLAAIRLAQQARADEALQQLQDDVAFIRRHLAEQDSLIGKMIVMPMLSEALDVSNLIASQHGRRLTLSALTSEERDFQRAMAHEMRFAINVVESVRDDPHAAGVPSYVPAPLARYAFKPNMTINALTPRYHRAIALSRRTPNGFAEAVAREPSTTDESPFWVLRNPVGYPIALGSGPYDRYVAGVMDLTAKIHLFNTAMGAPDLEAAIAASRNPYRETPERARLSEDGTQLCFDGPLEDPRGLRCLRVAL